MGDGDTSEWSNFGRPGHDFSESHAYQSAGTFTARVQVKDAHGAMSNWSGGHRVTVSVADFPCHVRAVAHGVGGHSIAILPDGQYVYTLGDAMIARYPHIRHCRCGLGPDALDWRGGQSPGGSAQRRVDLRVSRRRRLDMGYPHSDNQLVDSVRVGGGPLGMAALPNSQASTLLVLGRMWFRSSEPRTTRSWRQFHSVVDRGTWLFSLRASSST